jgi:hypothetical protein
MMLANDDLDIHAKFAGTSKNFDDASRSGHAAARETGKFDVNDSTVKFGEADRFAPNSTGPIGVLQAKFSAHCRRKLLTWWNHHFMGYARVIGKHDVTWTSVPEQTNKGRMRSVQDAQDPALSAHSGAGTGSSAGPARCSPARRFTALDTRHNTVTVHGVAECIATYEKVALNTKNWFVGHDESITIAMRHQAPGNLIGIAPWEYVLGSGHRGHRGPVSFECARVSLRTVFAEMSLSAGELVAPPTEFFNLPLALQLGHNFIQGAARCVAQFKRVSNLPHTRRRFCLR